MKPKSMILIVLGSLFLVACGFFFPFDRSPHGMGPDYWNWGAGYRSNGERIYFTAINDQGEYIRYTEGPAFGGMMGSNLACVSCHGEDGRGGQHVMHMQWMDAPDVRFVALAKEDGEHKDDDHDDAHGDEYNLETFRQAVVLGQHPDGDALSRDMPRWQMSDEDLADVLEYLKTLP